jgi:hypothetical protein
VITFYVVLTAAGGQDIISQKVGLDIEVVRNALRVLLFALPLIAGLLVWKVCRDLRASGVHAKREAETEPPIASYEDPVPPDPADGSSGTIAPIAPSPTPVPSDERSDRRRGMLFLAAGAIAAIAAWLRDRRRRRAG